LECEEKNTVAIEIVRAN